MNTNLNKTTYPQYRKYLNGMNYFMIISPDEMDEIHFIGKKCFITKLKAKILPDRNLIHDLTFDHEKIAVQIEREEFEMMKKKCGS